MTAAARPEPGAAQRPRVVELAAGVYAYLQLPGGWCVSNAGIVVGDDGALVVDTLATERRARGLRAAVDELCPGGFRLIVNTHHHGDHTFGNHLFGAAATVIAHELARTEMAETGLALTGLWPEVDWGDVRVTLPTLTFRDRLTARVGGHTVELLHVGPAHTTNDVVVWLPEARVLFAGDVVLAGATPFTLMGSISGSIAALRRLRELDATAVVCGHGAVTGPEVYDETLDYLLWVRELAEEGARAGIAPLELARATPLGRFEHLLDSERLVANLHRAYAELAGGPLARPLDVLSIFAEMVEFNAGRVPTCWA
ncbi:MBL fold metallo-hydrolase [Nocardia sp. NPDC057353]|uniref:MBL fold metallo-hydrolase n=1 Tax=Nocardia sp. NPDC057353 TaxID=3346104 RepID=UPI003638DD6C